VVDQTLSLSEDVPLLVYKWLCPNCGDLVDSHRLYLGLPCRRCLPKADKPQSIVDVATELEKLGTLKGYKSIIDFYRKFNEFSELFKQIVGYEMWGAQRLWARRLVKGKSFAVVAPTGSGKTTFGIVAAVYVVRSGGRVLMMFPTSVLAYQVYQRTLAALGKVGVKARVVTYNTLLSERERREALDEIRSGNYDILIVTTAFLPRYFDLLKGTRFDLVFADDVDSVLKATSRNIDRILMLIGVPEEILRKALEMVNLMKQLLKLRRFGGRDEEVKRLEEELEKLRRELDESKRNLRTGLLIASGALAKARRTLRLLLFREFLNFDVGGRAEGLRNVVDAYVEWEDGIEGKVLSLVKRLGPGGLILIPPDRKELAKPIVDYLNSNGVPAGDFTRPRRKVLEEFVGGSLSVLVGIATARSPLVRGIDLPHVIRYAIFVGVPKIRFRLNIAEFSPTAYLTLFYNIRSLLEPRSRREVDRLIVQLRNILGYVKLDEVLKALEKGEELTGFDKYVSDVISRAVAFARELLSNRDLVERINREPTINIEVAEGQVRVVIPDVTTYIQGSGRTSRLYAGGLSTGLSVVIVDDGKVFEGLKRELRLRFEEATFRRLDELALGDLLHRIDEERKIIRGILEGRIPFEILERKELIKSVLILVESPTKARTIAGFFGRPSRRMYGPLTVYEVSSGDAIIHVVASLGHVVDLQRNLTEYDAPRLRELLGDFEDVYCVLKTESGFVPVYNTIKRCGGEVIADDITQCPNDGTPFDSKLIIDAIRDLATEIDEVYVGTDPDAEGEKIGWDLSLQLRPYLQNIKRIEFHEVTRRAIMNALLNPRDFDLNLVKAQLIRRIEDRWIGFKLSKKLQEEYGRRTLSAGRVQTPVLAWIVERYLEARRGNRFLLNLELENKAVVNIELPLHSRAIRWLERELREGRIKVRVEKVDEGVVRIPPPPPYTTDSMLKDAIATLRRDADTVMRIAQDLFESGLITYHRTDSTRVSSVGLSIARDYITRTFGADMFRGRTWETGLVGAHEAIRPTRPIDDEELRGLVSSGVIEVPIRLRDLHYALYRLIFRRFMASQMAEAEALVARYRVSLLDECVELTRVVKYLNRGFKLITGDVEEGPLEEGEYRVVDVKYRKLPRVRLLTESDLVSMMRERGIGRPSTYARIVSLIVRRGYAKPIGGQRYMVPTKWGFRIYGYLYKNSDYAPFVNEERTRQVESLMSAVESGRENYVKVLNELYEEIARVR